MFDLKTVIERATDAYLASQGVGIPDSIQHVTGGWPFPPREKDVEPPDQHGRNDATD